MKQRIIVAEDDDAMRAIVVEALSKDGYCVTSVVDGAGLQNELRADAERTFDLIISDVRMPVHDGLAIIDKLRARHCATPVILMTAFGDDMARASANRLKAVMLEKPFDLDDLRTLVLNLL